MNKKLIIGCILASMALFTGCNGTQPVPTASGGQSKASTLSGNETEFMTGEFNFKFFSSDTTIIGKDGTTITFVPNPPTLNKQKLTF